MKNQDKRNELFYDAINLISMTMECDICPLRQICDDKYGQEDDRNCNKIWREFFEKGE